MARVERRFFQIVLTDQLQNLIVEIESVGGENRDRFRKFRGVGVLISGGGGGARGLRCCLMLGAEDGQRGLNSETAFAFAALGSGFLGGGEGERTDREEQGLRFWVEMVVMEPRFGGDHFEVEEK